MGKNQSQIGKKKKIDRIEDEVKKLIVYGRSKGWFQAVKHLEHFLAGSGNSVKVPVNWLRNFGVIKRAQVGNNTRFAKSLLKISRITDDNSPNYWADRWDYQIKTNPFFERELYYASGYSTLTSFGYFKVEVKGKMVHINGKVIHKWHDQYDWHHGLRVPVLSISDSQMLQLQRYRGAQEFLMYSNWEETITGKFPQNWLKFHFSLRKYFSKFKSKFLGSSRSIDNLPLQFIQQPSTSNQAV